jgi:hypothetical protein
VLLERCTVLETLADEARAGALSALEGRDLHVMTRENTAQLLEEMGTGADCSEGECEVETAKLVGADYVVSGNVVLIEGTWFMTMKLHDVGTAKLLRTSDRIEGTLQLALVRAVRPAADAMVRAGLKLATGPDAPGPSATRSNAPPSPGAGAPREQKLALLRLGVSLLDFTPEVARVVGISPDDHGAVVAKVFEGGPAQRAGIRQRDVILEVNRQPVKKVYDVSSAVMRMRDGEMALLRVRREGSTFFVAVPVGALR